MKEKSSGPPKTTDQSTSHFYNGGRNANLAKTTFSHGNSTLVSTMFKGSILNKAQKFKLKIPNKACIYRILYI